MKKTKYIALALADVLFCIIHIVCMVYIGDSKDLGLIPLAIGDLLFCLIYLLIHGVATYCIYRSVLYPHLLTGIVLLVSSVFLFLCFFGNNPWVLGASLFLFVFYVVSIIASLITMGVFKIYNRFKSTEHAPNEPK